MRIYLTYLLLFSLSISNVNAQTTLNASNTIPAPGTTHNYDLSFSFVPNNMYNTGSGQTWDFTSMVKDTITSFVWLRPSQTGDGSNFPQAPLALSTSGLGQTVEEFYEITNTTFKMLGQTVIGTARMTISDAREILEFPMTQGSSGTGTWAAKMDVFQNPVVIDRAGTTTYYSDAEGTAITPLGTFNNVRKVIWTDSYSDQVSGIPTNSYNDTVVWWFDGVNPGPLATYLVNWTDGNKMAERTIVRTGTTTDIQAIVAENPVTVYPNPSSGRVVLSGVEKIPLFDLYSGDGRLIRTFENDGLNEVVLHLEDLNSGFYLIKFRSNSVEMTQRLVIR